MNTTAMRLAFALFLIAPATNLGQTYAHSETAAQKQERPSFTDVIKQTLSDPELKEYELRSSVMEVPPAYVDQTPHRHDAELFGFVLEGTVEIQLEQAAPVPYKQGQMFYESRNVLHSMLKNPSSNRPAKVLLIFVIKKGRPSYTAEPAKP